MPVPRPLLLLASSVLVAVTATAVGYAVAVSLPPLLAQLVSQVLLLWGAFGLALSVRALARRG